MLPMSGKQEPCPPCNPGFYNNDTATCSPCPPGTFSDGLKGMEKIANTSFFFFFFCPPLLDILISVTHFCKSTACKQCPAGTEPTLGFEYKWWNTLPANMKTSCFNVGNNKCDGMSGGCQPVLLSRIQCFLRLV